MKVETEVAVYFSKLSSKFLDPIMMQRKHTDAFYNFIFFNKIFYFLIYFLVHVYQI